MAEEKQEYLDLEGLTEYHSKVNDMTTGVNLIRGSKDFRIGQEVYKDSTHCHSDGFRLAVSYDYNLFEVDNEGFTVEKLKLPIATLAGAFSSAVPLYGHFIKGDYITISYELMLEEGTYATNESICYACIKKTGPTTVHESNLLVGSTFWHKAPDLSKIGEWQQVVAWFPILNEVDEDHYFYCRPQSQHVGTVGIRKLAVYKGQVNNPVWSQSPMDTDVIEIEEPGINLFRGTRDFTQTTNFNKGNKLFPLDGVNIPSSDAKRSIDEDGFTVIEIDRSSLEGGWNYWGYMSLIEVNEGDKITLSAEFKADQLADGTIFSLQYWQEPPDGETLTQSSVTAPGTNIINTGLPSYQNIEKGKWFKYVRQITIPSGVRTISFRGIVTGNGHVYYRKFMALRGHIDNPVWSPSPFDLASSYDWNNGVPLLQGMIAEDHVIKAGDNLNDFVNPGRYVGTSTALVDTVANLPEGMARSAFTLDVSYVDNNSGHARQILTLAGEVATEYTRYCSSTGNKTWSAWVQSYGQSTAPKLLGEVPKEKQIPADSDLNNYTTPGTYACVSNSFIASLVNKPNGLNAAFTMDVSYTLGARSNSIRQKIETYYQDVAVQSWVREQISLGNWTNWRRVWNLTSVIPIEGGGTGGKTAAEAVENLGINDNTTGINLLRGTRDFKRGTIKKLGNDLFFEDGFYLSSVGSNNSTILEDPNGFKYVHLSQTKAENSEWWGSGVAGAKKGEWYTVYFDFMVDNPSTYNFDDQTNCHVCFRGKDGYQSWMGQLSLKISSKFDTSKLEAGKWYTFSHSFEITADSGEYGLIVPLVRQALPGTINFAKVGLCKGKVNHPIWSNSPLDEALGPINDETSGINLLRGTRDITPGTSLIRTNYYSDGFYIPANNYATVNKSSDGFGELNIYNPSANSSAFIDAYTSVIEHPDQNTIYTVSFEFKIENYEEWNNKNTNIAIFRTINDSFSGITTTNISFPSLGITNPESDKWYKVVATIDSTDAYGLYLILRAIGNVNISYRKIAIYKGHVINPVWSASSFDVDYINDKTTGINLFRGTRDFTIGEIPLNQYEANYKQDGFRNGGGYTFYKDVEGFTVAKLSQSGVTSPNYKTIQASGFSVEPKGSLTLSFEVMIDDISALDDPRIYTLNIATKNSGSWVYKKSVELTVSTMGLSDIKSGEWRQAKAYVDWDVEPTEGLVFVSAFQLAKNGSVNFRKLKIEKGHVNNPIWSASPFDLASSFDWNNGVPALLHVYPISIPENADLNDYIEPGNYRCISSATAKTLTNCPDELSFKMQVTTRRGDRNDYYRTQIMSLYSHALPSYYRNFIIDNGKPIFENWVTTYLNPSSRPIAGGGTGGNTVESAQDNLRIFTASPTNAADLNSIPKGLHVTSTGLPTKNVPLNRYYLVDQLQNASSSWKFQFAASTNVNPSIHVRNSINSSNWNNWVQILTDADYPYNPGTYVGSNIASVHKDEIGSNHVANWISSKVSQGDFTGLNIGDYVDINCGGTTRRYAIAAIDPYYNYGTQAMPHHIAMALVNGAWKLSSSLDGSYAVNNNHVLWKSDAYNNGSTTKQNPYSDSMLHAWEIEKALTQFPQEWQDVMIERYALMESKFSASSTLNDATGILWVNLGKLWSFSEVELFGRVCQGSLKYACASDTQFPLFSKIGSLSTFTGKNQVWLRNTVEGSSSWVCALSVAGAINTIPANNNTMFAYPGFFIG